MITLVTTLYEKNFRHILNYDNWFIKYENPLISKKLFIVNNIDSVEEFNKLKSNHNNVLFIESAKYIDRVNSSFNIIIDVNDVSYKYSIQHYLSIILDDDNPYVLQVGSDCEIKEEIETYIVESINLLNNNDKILSTTIPWAPNATEIGIHEEKFFNIKNSVENFYMSKIFSDQFFLSNKKRVLNNVDFSDIRDLHNFPTYGGNSFEKIFTNTLISKDFYRAIYKTNNYYTHKSF